MKHTVKFIDLFAGIGGTRIGFENACKKHGVKPECVFTSEIKEHAIEIYKKNFGDENIYGDITKIASKEIPDFDFLLAGFPCQPFSSAGNRRGFMDTRGTLFFEIERILKEKKPYGFLLENVEGLVNHDKVDKSHKMGRTLETIIQKLTELGYQVNWSLMNAAAYGIPQNRKRVYIVGTRDEKLDLDRHPKKKSALQDILEHGLPPMESKLAKKLLEKYSREELYGKSVKDKRGGKNNIHSWDIELKGKVSAEQKDLLNKLLTERRKKIWAEKKGIVWMDGMSLTLDEIYSFYDKHSKEYLKSLLDDLVTKGYIKYEHPKNLIKEVQLDGTHISKRAHDVTKDKGYNIVTGKLSFEISKILDPNEVAPTLVATDVIKLSILDEGGLRRLTPREGMRLFGFPESFDMNGDYIKTFDLLGNTVVVPMIQMISEDLVNSFIKK